jgi:release factor glutamine methyltransferase
LDAAAGRRFAELVRRRLRREPLAYIVGRRAFRHIELVVDRRVLIPRPETELLVELALELEPETVLDVGTGSGAVALAVADELPGAAVRGTDIYPETLEVAQANAERLGLAERVRFELGSLPADGEYDLLLANLPYVSARDWLALEPELRDFEPRGALTPGPTGLEAFEALLGELSVSPVRAGAIGLEVGEGQWRTVAELVRRAGFEPVEVRPDLAGIERMVVGR